MIEIFKPLIWDSKSASFDSDAQAFITAAGITDATQKTAINNLVIGLKSAANGNLWTNCFTGMPIHPIVGGNAAAHSVNLKNPGTNNIVWSGSITHSATGVLGDGSTGYGNDGFVPSVGQVLNNAGFSFYSGTNNIVNGIDFGCNDGTVNHRLACYFGSILPIAEIVGVNLNGGATRSDGFYTIVNVLNVSHKSYQNGIQIATSTSASVSLPTVSMNYLSQNSSGTPGSFSIREMRFGAKHTGMTPTQASNFYTLVQAFQTALGRNV